MNLRSTRTKKKTSRTSYDNDGFYASSNYNNNTAHNNYNQQPEQAQYYDDHSQPQQTYDDSTYAQNDTNYTADTWDTNQNDTNFYSEPEVTEKKKNRFVRPRPKRNISSHSSSFQPQQKSTSSSFQPQRFESSNTINTSSNTQSSSIQSNPMNQTASMNANDLLAAGLTAAGVTGMGSNLIQSQIKDKISKSILPSILSLTYYKYYFRVDNDYVLKKLTRILLPFTKMKVKQWRRKKMNEVSDDNTAPPPKIESAGFDSYSYQAPIYDINAPDGYLPLMAIVTYVVIMGFVVGTQSSAEGDHSIQFSPQILIATGSSAFVMLCIEVLLMKIGFYLIGSVATPPFWLDIVCYTGYKTVFVIINLVFNLIFDSLILYYVISVTTGIFAAIFMIQTLRPYFRDLSEFASGPLRSSLADNEPKQTRKIFLGIVGIAQILFIQLMGRYTSV